MTNWNIPNEYGAPGQGGWTWNPDANETFQRNNGFDPTTGAPTGNLPIPPADIAVQWQGQHDRMVWQYRQNLMRSASNFARGGLGLMQSFRQGGSAALEAGQYNTLAGIQLQRAGMTQPLDLLGDYRRHEMAMNRQQANRQAERQIAVQSAAAVAQIAATIFGGGAGAGGAASGIAGLAQALSASGPQTGQVDPRAYGGGGMGEGVQFGPRQGQGGAQGGGQTPGFLSPDGGQTQQAQLQGGPQGQPQGSYQAPGTQQAQQGQPGQMPGQGAPQGGPGAQGGPGGAQGAGPGGMGAGGMGGGMAVGADGNFTPVAYASNAAMSTAQDPIQQLVLERGLANDLESDPIWRELSYGIDMRLRERLVA